MNTNDLPKQNRPESRHIVAAILTAFLAILVVDFLTHAVVLSKWWRTTAAFWRPPIDLAHLIPVAYASFLLYAAGLTWVLIAFKGNQPRMSGAISLSAAVGTFIGITGVLATYSVLPIPASALLIFPITFTIDLVCAGAVISNVLAAKQPWRRFAFFAMMFLLLFICGVVIQNLLFPTPPTTLQNSSVN